MGTLSRYIYMITLAVLIEYLGLLAAVQFGPYSGSIWALPWLTVLAVMPVLSFTWGIYQIHVLKQEIKLHHLNTTNLEIKHAFAEFQADKSKDYIEVVATLANVHKQIAKSNEWPTALLSLLTFLLAAIAAGGQIIASIASLLEP